VEDGLPTGSHTCPIKNAGVYAQILGKMHKSIWQKLAQIAHKKHYLLQVGNK